MDKQEGDEQEIAVKKVYLHPKWSINTHKTQNGDKISARHDIALVELSRPVEFTAKVKSMCLDNGQPFEAGKVTLA